jgi:hypothetical protein
MPSSVGDARLVLVLWLIGGASAGVDVDVDVVCDGGVMVLPGKPFAFAIMHTLIMPHNLCSGNKI